MFIGMNIHYKYATAMRSPVLNLMILPFKDDLSVKLNQHNQQSVPIGTSCAKDL